MLPQKEVSTIRVSEWDQAQTGAQASPLALPISQTMDARGTLALQSP